MRIWSRKQTQTQNCGGIQLYSRHKLWKKRSTLHAAKLQKSLNSTHCKVLEWQVMNDKTNSNSMRNMYKNNTSFLIQERARLNVSKNLTICSLMVVFWANVMNEQWQINNLISWKFLSKNPYVNHEKQFAWDELNRCVHAS